MSDQSIDQRSQFRRLDQAGFQMKIKELAATRVRYRYRRIHVLLRREGWEINHKRTHRLYREMGLQLRSKTPKPKVKTKLRDDRTAAPAPNECWSMDFLSDQLFDGRKIGVLSIIDHFSRVPAALDVRISYCGADVVQTLGRVAASTGGTGYAWIMGQNVSRRTWICGPEPTASFSTSAGPVSRRTTPLSSLSTVASGRNASTHSGS